MGGVYYMYFGIYVCRCSGVIVADDFDLVVLCNFWLSVVRRSVDDSGNFWRNSDDSRRFNCLLAVHMGGFSRFYML